MALLTMRGWLGGGGRYGGTFGDVLEVIYGW